MKSVAVFVTLRVAVPAAVLIRWLDMHTKNIACRLILLSLLAVVAVPTHADDLVVLSSGSRMLGTLRKLERGDLTFSVAGAGRVGINWRNVESLHSERRLDIGLMSGERLTGTVSSTAPGQLDIVTDSASRTVAMTDVSRIHPVEATRLARTSGTVDLGLEFLSANSERNWTLNSELVNRTQNYRTALSIDSLWKRRNDETAQRRNRLEIDTRRFLDDRWFALGLFQAEEDRELDLDLRALIGAAVGRTLLESNSMALSIYGGLDVAHEEFRGVSDGDQDVVELLGAVQWDWFEVGEDLQFLIYTRTYIAPDDGRVRVDVDGSLRRNLTANYHLSLNLYESYNSDPPEDLRKSDLGISLTFGRSF